MPDLTEIGLVAEIWNSDTDPGGTGEPAGPEDGQEVDREYDDDGEPVYRPRPRRVASVDPIPGVARSSFAEWETALTDRAVLTQAPAPRYLPRPSRSIGDQVSECRHCARGACEVCHAAGQCQSCLGWLVPGHPDWRVNVRYRPSQDFYQGEIMTPQGERGTFVYTTEEQELNGYIRGLIRRTARHMERAQVLGLDAEPQF